MKKSGLVITILFLAIVLLGSSSFISAAYTEAYSQNFSNLYVNDTSLTIPLAKTVNISYIEIKWGDGSHSCNAMVTITTKNYSYTDVASPATVKYYNPGIGGYIKIYKKDCTYSMILYNVSVKGYVEPNTNPVYTPNCSDSDNGLDYFVKGSVNGVNQGGLSYSYTDNCSVYGVLQEHSCTSDNHSMTTGYACPNGCSNGACINSTTPNPTCTDSDGGLNYYVYGELNQTFSSAFHADYCMDSNQLNEWSCITNGTFRYDVYTCPNGCSSGACINSTTPNPTCTDSDGGLNYYAQGTTINNSYKGQDSCFIKQFSNANIDFVSSCKNTEEASCGVNEYFCSGTQVNLAADTCPTSCLNGACINETPILSCSSLVSLMKNPKDIIIDQKTWQLQYNSTYEYGNQTYSQASWRYLTPSYSNEYHYAWTSISELEDQKAVQEQLDRSLEYNLCDKQRVYFKDDSEDYQIVYVCKNIWRIASDAQKVSPQNSWNYNNDVVVIWFNDNKLFNMEFTLNDYYSCSDSESCEKMENWNHMRRQEDLITFTDSLLNNQGKWTGVYMDYLSETFVRYFLKACSSQITGEGYIGSWNCKQEPVLCPPHGEQKQICKRYNSEIEKEETRETTIQCSPGICSGCYVPRWFESKGDNKCIPYGFRFSQQNGWSYEIREYGSSETISESSKDAFVIEYIDATTVKIRTVWNNVTYSNLKEGDSVNLDLTGLDDSDYLISAKMSIKDIEFSSKEDVPSKVLVTFSIVVNEKIPSLFNAYCDIDGQIKPQKTGAWEACQNNYECVSNLCSYGECVDLKGIVEEANMFKSTFVKVICKLSNIFSQEEYNQCVYKYLGEPTNSSSSGGGSSGTGNVVKKN